MRKARHKAIGQLVGLRTALQLLAAALTEHPGDARLLDALSNAHDLYHKYRWEVTEYRAIPSDAPTSCPCDGPLELPEFLASQLVAG